MIAQRAGLLCIDRLLKHAEPRVVYADVLDSDEASSGGNEGRVSRDPGLTFNTRGSHGLLTKRIDYAFLRPGGKLSLRAINTFPDWRFVAHRAPSLTWAYSVLGSIPESAPASDHLGLVLDLNMHT